jgi:hypothetical protein
MKWKLYLATNLELRRLTYYVVHEELIALLITHSLFLRELLSHQLEHRHSVN